MPSFFTDHSFFTPWSMLKPYQSHGKLIHNPKISQPNFQFSELFNQEVDILDITVHSFLLKTFSYLSSMTGLHPHLSFPSLNAPSQLHLQASHFAVASLNTDLSLSLTFCPLSFKLFPIISTYFQLPSILILLLMATRSIPQSRLSSWH